MALAPTDTELLRAYRGGDADAFAALYRRHAQPLLAYLVAMLQDRTDAEEVLQQVFVAFAGCAGELKIRGSLRAYLFTAARNRMLNLHRRKARAEKLAEDFEAVARLRLDDGVDVAAGLEAEELRIRLNWALARLPDDQREAVLMHTQGEMSFAEVSEALDEPRSTVATRYRAGLFKLRELML